MGIFFPKKDELFLIHQTGIDQYGKGWAVSVQQNDTEVTFTPRIFKDFPTIHLPIEKIVSAKEEVFKAKRNDSALGRALVGDFLFGETGAIVGAMTAGKMVSRRFYVIRYKSNGRQKAIVLSQQTGGATGFRQWNEALNAKLPAQPEKPKDVTL